MRHEKVTIGEVTRDSSSATPDLLDSVAVRLDELDYVLPSPQIAQRPLPRRDSSRLLAMDRATGKLADRMFAELPGLLRGEELIVLNNARVIPARLFGRRLEASWS
jgi:S-adenosylmethionine:tRNA ribosyltransferase-isomerase